MIPTPRRTFLKYAAYAGATLPLIWPAVSRAISPNKKLNIAGIGVGGKGWGDINSVSKGQNVVAVCDVDKNRLAKAAQTFAGSKSFSDYRKMFDAMAKDIDGCTVSTPDHMHAPITMTAIQLGKHTYTQKPMTHTVQEARAIRLAAERAGTVTQMGNQNHSGAGYKMLVELVRSGAIGKVNEAHAWSNRPIWPQGHTRPQGEDPVPNFIDWDLWLGVAPHRPFVGKIDAKGRGGLESPYLPFKWRGFIDFGTGAQGDMACHIMDPIFWALALDAPKTVWSEAPKPNGESYPEWSIIKYIFPGTMHTAKDDITVTWYDGHKLPPIELARLPEGLKLPQNGSLIIGEKGVIMCPHGSAPRLFPVEDYEDYAYPKIKGDDHYMQWTHACLGEGKTTSNFDYAGRLTEMVLLGNIALRYPMEKLMWNTAELKFDNNAGASALVTKPYRNGWGVEGLG